MDSITVKFQLNEGEHYNAWKIRQSLKGVRYWFDRPLATVLLLGGVTSILIQGPAWWNLVMLFGSAAYLSILLVSPFILRKQFRADPKFRSPQQLTFSNAGIKYNTDGVDSNLDWKFYSGIVEADDLILLVYSKHQHSIIPKRSFNSADEMGHFLKMARGKINQYKNIHSAAKKLPTSVASPR